MNWQKNRSNELHTFQTETPDEVVHHVFDVVLPHLVGGCVPVGVGLEEQPAPRGWGHQHGTIQTVQEKGSKSFFQNFLNIPNVFDIQKIKNYVF